MKTTIRFLFTILITTYILGCTSTELYQYVEQTNKFECRNIHVHTQYEECMDRAGESSNRDQRKR